jgi:AraC family transcriptional regulator
MNISVASYDDRARSPVGFSAAGFDERPVSSVDFSPAKIVRRQTAHWRGLHGENVQITSHEPFEYRFKDQYHLLIAAEQAARVDGETLIEGLPRSTRRDFSHKLTFVPAGRTFYGSQSPRILTRSTYLYIDPQAVPVDPGIGFSAAELAPRLFFEDSGIWQTVLKLKALIGRTDAGDRMYAEALGGVLAHELMRLGGAASSPVSASRGGLAPWQQKRVALFIDEHLADDISLGVLAGLVRLSPYHFLRSFKQSFGEPPYRWVTGRRIERAKTLLTNSHISVTEVALGMGFSSTSAFSATFHRFAGQTPTDYRRSLE